MKKKHKCKVCKKEAIYYEWSLDGETDYFCSEEHHKKYKEDMQKKGYIWRANELAKIKED